MSEEQRRIAKQMLATLSANLNASMQEVVAGNNYDEDFDVPNLEHGQFYNIPEAARDAKIMQNLYAETGIPREIFDSEMAYHGKLIEFKSKTQSGAYHVPTTTGSKSGNVLDVKRLLQGGLGMDVYDVSSPDVGAMQRGDRSYGIRLTKE